MTSRERSRRQPGWDDWPSTGGRGCRVRTPHWLVVRTATPGCGSASVPKDLPLAGGARSMGCAAAVRCPPGRGGAPMPLIAAWNLFMRSVWLWVRRGRSSSSAPGSGCSCNPRDLSSRPVGPWWNRSHRWLLKTAMRQYLERLRRRARDATRPNIHGGWQEMSETQQAQDGGYVVSIRIVDGQQVPVPNAHVFTELLDVDIATQQVSREMRHYYGTTDQDGQIPLLLDPQAVQEIRRGDGTAQMLVVASSPEQGLVGSDTIQIKVRGPQKQPWPVQIYSPSAPGTEPPSPPQPPTPPDTQTTTVVEFKDEVLDAILSLAGGGATAGSSSATTGVFDDRFFEERLRRLIGANVRAGDVAGLRREIDRVVVEENVEG